MPPRRQRPDYALAGQHRCRRNFYDVRTGKITGVCGNPVPEGDLPYLAHNTRSGHFLVLCGPCQEELGALYVEWASASFGTASLVADLVQLPNGVLISEDTLKGRLEEAGEREKSKSGNLTTAQRQRAIELEMARREATA